MNDQPDTAFPAIAEAEIGGARIQTVDARDLHVALEVGRDFSSWIKDRVTAYGFVPGSDFVTFEAAPQNGGAGARGTRIEYALSIDMAKQLAMVERNDAGQRVRRYFIDCERRLKSALAVDPLAVLNDAAAMRGLLLNYSEKVLALEADRAAMAPKVAAHDRIAEAYGSLCITDAAKTLQVPPKALFRWLRENGWIYRRHGMDHDIGYQTHITAGRLIHKVEVFEKPDGTDGSRTQVRVTPKGMTVLAKAFPPVAMRVA